MKSRAYCLAISKCRNLKEDYLQFLVQTEVAEKKSVMYGMGQTDRLIVYAPIMVSQLSANMGEEPDSNIRFFIILDLKNNPMKEKKNLYVTFLLLLISIYSYSTEVLNDSIATIKIKAKGCKDQTWNYFPAIPITILSVKLDSNGEGILSIPVKKKSFILLYANDRFPCTVFLEPGCDLVFSVMKGKSSFSGKGAVINNFLLKSKNLLSQLKDSINTIDNPLTGIGKFIRLCDYYEQELLGLYKKNYEGISPSREVDYLLRADMRAFILLKKEEFLSNFEQAQIDSLHLESRLGLKFNNLLKDTLLIKFPSSYFTQYLTTNYKGYMNRISSVNQINAIATHDPIQDATQYSDEIKEFLTFNNVLFELGISGPNRFIDSTVNKLRQKYSASKDYLAILNDCYKLFDHLMPGNPAPHLQGISPDGKIHSLNDFKGKVIFIDIWATWCRPCIDGFPHLFELQEAFINSKEVVFIFLSNDRDEEEETWKKYLSDHPEFKGIHLRARKEEDRPFEKLWKVTGIPRYMIINKEGKIVDAFAKNLSHEELKKAIGNAIAK